MQRWPYFIVFLPLLILYDEMLNAKRFAYLRDSHAWLGDDHVVLDTVVLAGEGPAACQDGHHRQGHYVLLRSLERGGSERERTDTSLVLEKEKNYKNWFLGSLYFLFFIFLFFFR